MRTIAIEITGHNFDNPEAMPSRQKIANVLGVIAAIQKRYQIYTIDILGHDEIYLGKPDPGKRFVVLIRYLVSLKAIREGDTQLMDLCFSPFVQYRKDIGAIQRYYKFLHSYLLHVSTPRDLFQWEQLTGYWNMLRTLGYQDSRPGSADEFQYTVRNNFGLERYGFLNPENHEGVDFTSQA